MNRTLQSTHFFNYLVFIVLPTSTILVLFHVVSIHALPLERIWPPFDLQISTNRELHLHLQLIYLFIRSILPLHLLTSSTSTIYHQAAHISLLPLLFALLLSQLLDVMHRAAKIQFRRARSTQSQSCKQHQKPHER